MNITKNEWIIPEHLDRQKVMALEIIAKSAGLDTTAHRFLPRDMYTGYFVKHKRGILSGSDEIPEGAAQITYEEAIRRLSRVIRHKKNSA